MDEDAINAAAIAAALDEDEGFAFAEKLQNEAYIGGDSAQGVGGAGSAVQSMMQEQNMVDETSSVRAPQA